MNHDDLRNDPRTIREMLNWPDPDAADLLDHHRRDPRYRFTASEAHVLADALAALEARLVAAETQRREATEVLEQLVAKYPRGCGVIHGNKPPGWTCLDTKRHAADPANRYSEDYRASILAGEHLCDVCLARSALAVLAAGRQEPRE